VVVFWLVEGIRGEWSVEGEGGWPVMRVSGVRDKEESSKKKKKKKKNNDKDFDSHAFIKKSDIQ
jgi:hypothetical protein